MSWRAGSGFRGRVAAIRAAGDPVELSELARSPIPPEDNATTYLNRANTGTTAIANELKDLLSRDDDWRQAPSAAQIKKIDDAFQAYPDVMRQIAKAAACPDNIPNHDFNVSCQQFMSTMTNDVAAQRSVFRILDLQTVRLQAQGKHVDAGETVLQAFQLARHIDREPMIVNYLVSLACRAIAINAANRVLRTSPDLPADWHSRLEEELNRHDDMAAYTWTLKSERAYGIQQFQTMTSGVTGLLVMWHVKSQASDYLDVFDRELRMGTQSWYEVTEDMDALYSVSGLGLGELIKPALRAARDAMNRSRAKLRCLRVLNKLVAERVSASVQPHSALAQLNLPSDAKVDPYNGQSLVLKVRDGNWLIYSVGANTQDDGGVLDSLADVGLGP